MVQEKNGKIGFQDGGHRGHLGIWTGLILAIFDLQVTLIPSFESVGHLIQEKKFKIDFQDSHHEGHLGFLIGMILAFSDLQVTMILDTKFQVS